MHPNCAPDHRLGISFIELLCAIAVLSMVTVVTVARLNIRAEFNQARCTHHLKETGLAFQQFANDNADRFPMKVSQTFGGAREAAAEGRVAGVFAVLADYHAKPEHVVCPGDTRSVALTMPVVTAKNLSYFVNLDADRSRPASPLLGDRDLTNPGANGTGAVLLTGLQVASDDSMEPTWSGTLHRDSGQLALVDGSVAQLAGSSLRDALRQAGQSPVRLLFPQ